MCLFQLMERTLMKLDKDELKQFKSHLSQDYPECTGSQQKAHEVLDVVKMLESCGREESLKITLHILRKMNQKDLIDSLERDVQSSKNDSITRQQLKIKLKKKFECIFEGLATQGHPVLLNEIYTELYITEGGSGGISNEHEVRQIETASKIQITEETAICCNDIFEPLPGQNKAIRTVLTKGIAGIGKTVSVQKFILDWTEEKANQDIHFIFPLTIRDLNLKKGREFSLMQLLQLYFPELKEIQSVECDGVKVLFIIDGLDECRLPLDFQNSEILGDVTKPTSVDMLLTNLINGNLFPSALLWITSRPAAASQLPPDRVNRVTEVRGFNDPQKVEYFRKRISDQDLANRIISHMKSSRSLYIMCHIPVFCWISAIVLEQLMSSAGSGEIPKTLTEMYTHFLLLQTDVKKLKYKDTIETNPDKITLSDKEIILKLGKLAFQQLEKGNPIFYVKDLKECGIDASEATVYSGVCTEIFKEESGLYQEKVYCFVHLSVQEYLAALFVFLTCVNEDRNLLSSDDSNPKGERIQLSELHRSAVDQALQSKNGHLDLFLRFLLGLSLDSIQGLLQGLLTQTGSRSHSIRETIKYIKEKIGEESSAERTINLFHCLCELDDNSLVEEIQTSLRSGTLSDKKLEPHQCSALAFVLLMSEEVLDMFELKMYNTSAAGYQRLLPVIKYCRKAILDSCDLTEESCDTVASALQSVPSHLIELDLSYNNLGDSGVERLCVGLNSPNCKLQRLRLDSCDLTEESCDTVASALQSVPSHLIELDLSYNNLGDSGVERLCAGLKSPNCKLQRLRLSGCRITERGCASLASALHSNPSHLRELDLSYNHPGDSGVRALSAVLEDPSCKLETLLLKECNLTEGCCDDLAFVLRSSHSELRDLELGDNDLQDSGVRALSAGLEDPHCKLQRLGLSGCRVTETGCASLASALRSNPSHLRELDLSYNHPGDSGVRALSAGLEDPSCKLETLLVDHGGENRNKPGLRKYACELTLDPNTVSKKLTLSEGDRKVTRGKEQPYPDHPERFDSVEQVLCREGLRGTRFYWETEWSGGWIRLAVAYKGINRKGQGADSVFGWNINSWSLTCSDHCYTVCHNNKSTAIPVPPFKSLRVGVYLDWPAGTLSFYSVSSDTLTLLHRFHTNFTEPLYPAFGFWNETESVSLCQLE
ncbi:NACHT, LRR and PYD domains-containing protein 12-like [Megalops cyprinoides]|uniref:NACHT, LRR and PYD domains-containing protein 12-like n=1 Tax=Megalops cyprinoides TaxID=118141 RepID=UPI00186454AE|nr:NACHT, LRR and PYD domains-containing protein 12-like [Megalops cyprinoides]